MTRPPEESTSWIAEKTRGMEGVEDVVILGSFSFRGMRAEQPPFVVGVISTTSVTAEHVQEVLAQSPDIEILVNIPKESIWTEGAIRSVETHQIAFGGIGDLMRAVRHEDIRQYVRPEFLFVERGLDQHDRVTSLERKADRVYLIHRNGLPDLRFVMLNEYELTADHIRVARQLYGNFDMVLLNNPNGNPTAEATELGRTLRVGIFKWGQFLGRLNSP